MGRRLADDTPGVKPKRGTVEARLTILKPFVLSVLCYGLGIAAVFFFREVEPHYAKVTLYLAAGLAFFVLWRQVKFENQASKYFSFGAVLLLSGVLNRALYLADFFQSDGQFQESPVFVADPELPLILGEVLTVGGSLLTILGWAIAGGTKYTAALIFSGERREILRVLTLHYVCSVVAVILSVMSPGINEVLGQLLPQISGLGSAASFILPSLWSRERNLRLVYATLMSVPFIAFAMGSGMKENLILALLPAGVFLWQALRSFWARVAIVVGGLALIALITAYVGYYRNEVWLGERSDATADVVEDFQEELSKDVTGTLSKGIEGFLNRANSSVHRGWAVSFAEQYGHQPELVFEPLVYVFVPRLIWPEKPANRQAWEYGVMLFGGGGESGSSMAAGFYTSLYLGGGWLPALAGALAVGWMLGHFASLSYRLGGPVLAGLFGFSLIPFALRLDEQWSVGGVSGPVVQFAYIVLLYSMNRALLAFLPEKRRS